MTREERAELALQALVLFDGVANLGDAVYDVREREGTGWDGPHVKQWSDASALAKQALTGLRLEDLLPSGAWVRCESCGWDGTILHERGTSVQRLEGLIAVAHCGAAPTCDGGLHTIRLIGVAEFER